MTPNFEHLAKLPALEGFTPEEMLTFVRIATLHKVQPGDRLIRAGDEADCFYIVASGALEIRNGDVPLAQLRQGHLVGEMPLLYSQPVRQADVFVLEPSVLLRFGYADYDRLVQESKELAKKFKANLAKIVAGRIWSTLPDEPKRHLEKQETKETNTPVREVMRQTEIFRGLKEEYLERLEAIALPVTASEHEYVVRKGDAAEGFYLVLEGFVDVKDGEKALARMGPGKVFGEMALVYHQPTRSADIVAVDKVRLLYFAYDEYQRLANAFSEIGKKLRATLGRVAASRSWSMPTVDETKR